VRCPIHIGGQVIEVQSTLNLPTWSLLDIAQDVARWSRHVWMKVGA
jgi:hypothetical protein